MSLKKKIKSEIIEVGLFLVFAALIGTWMTLTHSVRDLNVLLTQAQEEFTELTELRASLEKSQAHQANLTYLDERLFIEGTRYNAHVTYYQTLLAKPLYSKMKTMLPIQKWDPVELPMPREIEILVL